MNWLIVSLSDTTDEKVDVLKKLLYEYTQNVSLYVFEPQHYDSLFQAAADCGYCIWLGTPAFSQCTDDASASFLFGYLMGKNIPLFCVAENSGNEPAAGFLLSSPEFVKYHSVEQLLPVLKERFPLYLEQEKQQAARQSLLKAGIPFNPDSFAFHIAADDQKEFTLFIDGGIDINSRDAAGTPMLCIAARHNRLDMIKTLLQLGADINAVSKDRGYSPVMDAVWKSNETIVALLIEHGADLSCISRDGQPILVLAVGTGNEPICRLLVEHGADPTLCDSMGMTAISYAKLFKKDKLVSLFEAYKT